MRFLFAAFSIAFLAAPLAAGEATTQPTTGKVIGKVPAGIAHPYLQAVHSKGQWAIISNQFVELPAGTATSLSKFCTSMPQPTTQTGNATPERARFVGVSPDERYLLLKASDRYLIIYDIQERKGVTLALEEESEYPRWMGQNIVVDQLSNAKELLSIACYGTDGKKKDFPKIHGFPLGASKDGKLLIVGALSKQLDQKGDIQKAKRQAKTTGTLAMHVCAISRAGKVLHSHPQKLFGPINRNLYMASPTGKFFSDYYSVETKGGRCGSPAVTQVRALDGKVVNEIKGHEHPIGLLDDGRVVTIGRRLRSDDPTRGVQIWKNSKPTVLARSASNAIVRHRTVYYIGGEKTDSIRAIEIP